MGCAALTTTAAGEHCATVAIEIKLVAPMTAGMGALVAEARAEHRGRRQVTATGRLTRATDGGLIAHGMTTCLVVATRAD
jgi:acyl-coenzyme A thioesterase PaaI-like protein